MATDLERLVVTLNADIKKFEAAFNRAAKVSEDKMKGIEGSAAKASKRVESEVQKMARNLNGAFKGVNIPAAGSIFAGVTAALGVNEIAKLADTWSDLSSRVNLAAGSVTAGGEALDRIGEIARRTYSGLEQTAEGFIANATTLRELGYSTEQTLNFTESLNNALVVSGAKGQVAASVMSALSKAMALGTLSGDNLNTVIASGGRVAEALAEGLGTSVNRLRALGSQGKITGRDVVNALSSQLEKLRKEAESMPATISDGFQLLNNALLQYVGNADSATGISAKIADALVVIADNFDKVADAGLQVAAVFAAGILGRSIGNMIKSLGLGATALKGFTGALLAARNMGGVASAIGGIGAAAGPVGAIIGGAVVSSILLYNATLGKATEASELYSEALKKVKEQADETADSIVDSGSKADAGVLKNLKDAVQLSADEIDKINQDIIASFEHMLRSVDRSVIDPIEIQKVEELKDGFADGSKTAQQLADSLNDIARNNPDWVNFTAHVKGLAQQLLDAAGAAKILNDQLAIASSGIAPNTINAQKDYQRMRNDAKRNDEAAAQFLANQNKRAALTKNQLAVETEATRLRNEAVKEGIHLTEQQIQAQAKANVAANERRSSEGKKPKKEKKERENEYARLTKSIADRTAVMVAETEVQRSLNPLIDDYGYAIEKARTEQELLNAAQKAGVAITPELRKEIAAAAEQWALASVEANKLAESQDKIRQRAEEWRDTQKDALRGIVDDLIQGKSAADAFANALQKIGNKLLDMAFDDLFTGLFKSGGGGGGGIFGQIGKLFGFANGGYTGSGPRNQPKGIVHAGEVVWSQQDIARAGGVSAVEALRNGTAISPVAMTAPSMPSLKSGGSSSQNVTINFNPKIDATGADAAALGRVEDQLKQMKQELPATVIQTVRKAQNQNVKLG